MLVTSARLAVCTAVAAVVVCCVVQDRGTVEGVRRYVDLQRAALAGRGERVTIDAIVAPAVDRSIGAGLASGGGVLAAGLSSAAVMAMRNRRG